MWATIGSAPAEPISESAARVGYHHWRPLSFRSRGTSIAHARAIRRVDQPADRDDHGDAASAVLTDAKETEVSLGASPRSAPRRQLR